MTSLRESGKGESQLDIASHEVSHLYRLVVDPTGYQELRRQEMLVPSEYKTDEQEARKFQAKVIQEVTDFRNEIRMRRQGVGNAIDAKK
jgi:hypothetical protein